MEVVFSILESAIPLGKLIWKQHHKTSDEGNSTNDDFCQMLNDTETAIKQETTEILACLALEQKGKIDSAYEYINLAFSDLKVWSQEPTIFSNIRDRLDQTSISDSTVTVPSKSKYFESAIWQLREADQWATTVFNNRQNSEPIVRMEALHIRLFCRALLDYDNTQELFTKWTLVLEPFFEDREFVKYAMGEKIPTSRLYNDEKAKAVCDRFLQVTKSLERMIWSMLLNDSALVPYARKFALSFDEHSTLAPDVEPQSEWNGLRSFHKTFYKLTEKIELNLIAERLVVLFTSFENIDVVSSGRIWAIDEDYQLISFDAKQPELQSLVVNDERRWATFRYASATGKVYALSMSKGESEGEGDSQYSICVFDTLSNLELKNERIDLPPETKMDDFSFIQVTPFGSILFYYGAKRYVLFSDKCSDRKWFEMSKEISTEITSIIDGGNPNEIILLKQEDDFYTGDVIKKIEKQGQEEIVVETIEEKIQIPRWSETSYIAYIKNETSLNNSTITISYRGKISLCLISYGVSVDKQGKIVGFFVKDVNICDFVDDNYNLFFTHADKKLFFSSGAKILTHTDLNFWKSWYEFCVSKID